MVFSPPYESGTPTSSASWRRARTQQAKLIPIPGFLTPGYSSLSSVSVFPCFLPPGEILKSGVGITFWVPKDSDMSQGIKETLERFAEMRRSPTRDKSACKT